MNIFLLLTILIGVSVLSLHLGIDHIENLLGIGFLLSLVVANYWFFSFFGRSRDGRMSLRMRMVMWICLIGLTVIVVLPSVFYMSRVNYRLGEGCYSDCK